MPCRLGEARVQLVLTTDAWFTGFGATCHDRWLASCWKIKPPESVLRAGFSNIVEPPTLSEELLSNINYLEMIAACVAILCWAPLFSGGKVLIVSDDFATASFLSKGTPKNLEALEWLRKVLYCSLRFDFHVSARFSPGNTNFAADSLSRITESAAHSARFLAHFKHPFPGTPVTTLNYCSNATCPFGSSGLKLESSGHVSGNEADPGKSVEAVPALL